MNRSLLASVFFLAAASIAGAQELPSVVSFGVQDSPEGVAATDAPWRTWLAGSPAQIWTSAGAGVGAERPGSAWVRAAFPLGATMDRVAVVEQPAADVDAPGGWTAAVAVVRTGSRSHFATAPAVQLALLRAPSARAGLGSGADVEVAPLLSLGVPMLAADGLDGWSVERCTVALDACVVVGFVASASTPVSLQDAAPAGTWRWIARPVYAGGVTGPPSPASAAREVIGPCDEPSALDVRPSAEPLRVQRAGSTLSLTWEAMGTGWDLLGAALTGMAPSFAPLACDLAVPSWSGEDTRRIAAYVAVTRCSSQRSSLGRDSEGVERSGTGCP